MKSRGIVVHTVGVKGDASAANIRRYHMAPTDHPDPAKRGKGWKDIGYHRVVRKTGLVEPGRALWLPGAHLEGANDTYGFCVTGDGDTETWTLAQLQAFVKLAARFCRHHNWTSDVVRGHHEGPAYFGAKPTTKTCPGRLVDMVVVRGFVQCEINSPLQGVEAGLG